MSIATSTPIRRPSRQNTGLVLGPLSFATLLLFAPFDVAPAANAALAGTLWIAIWWVTEAIPIPATSLLPIVLFPLTGVVDVASATAAYADPVVFLLLGGFLLALGIERWGLHRRIALAIVGVVGVETKRLLLGFMLATGFLSMWISNSATALLMVPIGAAVVFAYDAGEQEPRESSGLRRDDSDGEVIRGLEVDPGELPSTKFGLALMLGIAYGASIGGVATLIGSPPNAVFAGVAESQLGIQITFLDWMLFAAPLSAAFMVISWLLLLALVSPESDGSARTAAIVEAQRDGLGPMSRPERRTLAIFVLVAGGWLLRPFVLQPLVPAVTDTIVALVGGLLLFVVPAGTEDRTFLLDWSAATRLPWGVLVLLGGGFSVANAVRASGLDSTIAEGFAGLGAPHVLVLLAVVATVIVFLTEVTSNTATATVFMPIMASLGVALAVPSITLMATTALAASFAFMLPVATPPNAVVFGSGYVTIPQMSRVGVWLNLLAIVAIVGLTYLWLPIAFELVG